MRLVPSRRMSLVLIVLLTAASAAAQNDASSGARRKPLRSIRRLEQRFHARVAAPATYQALCDRRLAGGPGGGRDPRVDLSAAHALVRQFSVSSAYATGDTVLAAALEHGMPPSPGALRAMLGRYAGGLDDVCAAPAGPSGLLQALVVQAGRVAVVRPGSGQVTLAPDTQLEVIDLRDLPASDDL